MLSMLHQIIHMTRFLIVGLLFASVFVSTAAGEEPAPTSPTVLAEVLGKKITEQDLLPPQSTVRYWSTLSAEEAAVGRREHRKSSFSGAVMFALLERYIKAHSLEPTEAEIQSFLRSPIGGGVESAIELQKKKAEDLRRRIDDPATGDQERDRLRTELDPIETILKILQKPRWPNETERREMKSQIPELEQSLRSPTLSDIDRKTAEGQLKHCRRFVDLTDEQAEKEFRDFESKVQRESAAEWVQSWKFHRALFKQYGGRIIWQQAGIEPIEAMRTWLEEQEKDGDFVIHDPELRKSFWEYYIREHPFTTEKPKGDEFDEPFWTKPPVTGHK